MYALKRYSMANFPLVFGICLLIALSSIPASAEKPITLRFTHHVSPNWRGVELAIKPYKEMIEEESNERIKIKFYFGGTIHGPKDGFKAAASGMTDLCPSYPVYSPGKFNIVYACGLPFLWPNGYVATLVMEKLYPKYFKQEFESMGVKLLAYPTTTPCDLITKKPVRKVEDLKGMKIRSAGELNNLSIKALGAVPVNIPYSDVYSALQNGLVDGSITSMSDAGDHRLYEVAKYYTKLNMTALGVAYAMNPKTYDSLPDDLKTLVYKNNRKFAQLMAGQYEKGASKAKIALINHGVEIIVPKPNDLAEFKAVCSSLERAFIEKNEAKGLPARQLLQDIRKEVEKYKELSSDEIWQLVSEHPFQGLN